VPTKKRARKIINEAFSERGRWTYWPYLRHQGYVYLQEYVENAGYDLRIVVIGDMVFGYYRYPPKGDFRASGLGEVRKHDLPEEAMCLAVSVVSRLNLIMGAVDMLYSSCERRYVVIEVSAFIRVDTPEQLIVGETPGVYLHREGTFSFRPGRYWIQEIALREFLTRTWIAPRLDDGTHGTV